jgi:hypothetical protein
MRWRWQWRKKGTEGKGKQIKEQQEEGIRGQRRNKRKAEGKGVK